MHRLSLVLFALTAAYSSLAASPPKSEQRNTAADAVVLKDGSSVLGEFVEFTQGGGLRMLVSRDWARSHEPDALKLWEAAESKAENRAIAQRLERLNVWKDDRKAIVDDPDSRRLTSWLSEEIARLGSPDALSDVPLIRVKFARGEFQRLDRAPKDQKRLLRLAWLSRLHDPEELAESDLKSALEGRGFDLKDHSLPAIDKLMPLANQSEAKWLVARAATEVLHDPGLRFVSVSGFLTAEPKAGDAIDLTTTLQAASSTIKQLLGDDQVEDPLPAKLRQVAETGHVGAVVTELQFDPGMQGVTVQMTLWVQAKANGWIAAGSRRSSVKASDVGPGNGEALAEDPQVKTVFRVAEALGLGEITNEIKGQSLNMGAATQKALAQTRKLANDDLNLLGIAIE